MLDDNNVQIGDKVRATLEVEIKNIFKHDGKTSVELFGIEGYLFPVDCLTKVQENNPIDRLEQGIVCGVQNYL
jgi:hypothetical protein